jgi:energy-coupling factor transporter transmembrane protein EcfT
MRDVTRLPHTGLWGTSRGVIRSLVPEVRLLSALAAVTTCLLADPASWPGLVLSGATVCFAWIAVRPPLRRMAAILLLATVMLVPFFLLAPWSEGTIPRHVLPGIAPVVAPWRIVVTGLSVLAVSSTAASSLTRSDLREGLARLPVPRFLAAVVLQIVMQSDLLAQEAGRIMLALRARGATHGLRNRIRVVSGLARVWLPRLKFKADRVALAMVARDYPTRPVALENHRRRVRDGVALASTVAWTAAALLTRLGYVP